MGLYTDRGLTVAEAKQAGTMEIESWFGGKTLDVFDSNVLGTPHRYYCSEDHQLRFINGKVANVTSPLLCGPIIAGFDGDPVYTWINHTSTEAGKLQTEYVQFTKDIAVLYYASLDAVAAATTVAEIDTLIASLIY